MLRVSLQTLQVLSHNTAMGSEEEGEGSSKTMFPLSLHGEILDVQENPPTQALVLTIPVSPWRTK